MNKATLMRREMKARKKRITRNRTMKSSILGQAEPSDREENGAEDAAVMVHESAGKAKANGKAWRTTRDSSTTSP